MFGFLKSDPKKKLQQEFEKKLADAVEAQRNGNIELYAKLSTEAEEILKKIEELAPKG
ncbi:MAG: DUF6435 family protein [Bacteriovoracaceae bacterium]|jgi:hypothetical protein